MTPRFDVLGLGCVGVDEVVAVEAFPAEDGKAQIVSWQRYAGGTTANAVCAAATAGASAAFAGTLGCDAASQFALDDFARRGVDTRWMRRQPDTRPIHTIVVTASGGSRTILYDLTGARGAEVDWPPADVIASTHYLLIDQFGMEGNLRAARLAHAHNVEVIADFERTDRPEFAELLPLIDHLFMPLAAAKAYLKQSDPLVAAGMLADLARSVAVLTEGANGLWMAGRSTAPAHLPAAPAAAIETTACGDVLRGIYAAALARRLTPTAAIHVAMRAAAKKAESAGGRDSYPSLDDLA
jgi:ribokinase